MSLLQALRDPGVGSDERRATEVAGIVAHRSLETFVWMPALAFLAVGMLAWLAAGGLWSAGALIWTAFFIPNVFLVIGYAWRWTREKPTVDNAPGKIRASYAVMIDCALFWGSLAWAFGPSTTTSLWAVALTATSVMLVLTAMNPGPPVLVLLAPILTNAVAIGWLVPAPSPRVALLSTLYLAVGLFLALLRRWATEELAVASLRNRNLASQLQVANENLAYRATHDGLTGLTNRVALWNRLDDLVAKAEADGSRVGLLFMDLDRFKHINDTKGHAIGDALLRHTGGRLQRIADRHELTIGRVGGDEFVILLGNADDEWAWMMAERILAAVDSPFAIEGQTFHMQATAGVVVGAVGEPASELYRKADAALYRAKESGRGCVGVYDPSVDGDGPSCRRPAPVADTVRESDRHAADLVGQAFTPR